MRIAILCLLTTCLLGSYLVAEDSSFWKMMSFGKSAEKGKDAGKKGDAVEKDADAPQQARSDWQRRVAVINKLREIALRLNDQELMRQCDQLDQRAFDVYMQHTGRIVATDIEK